MTNGECVKRAGVGKGSRLLIALSWLVYTCSYLGKVNYSANITQIMDFYGVSKSEAGAVPSFFFFAYGAGQVVNGFLSRRYNIKWAVFGSLSASALVNLIIGITPHFAIVKWLWMVNGFALSILWPTLIRLLSESLPQNALSRSTMAMGTTVAGGTLVIYGLSALFALFHLFRPAFYTAAAVDFAVALLWLFFYQKVSTGAKEERARDTKERKEEEIRAPGIRRAGKHEMRLLYVTVALLCLYAVIVNLTKDGLTTWVPSILKESFAIGDSLSILLTLALPMVALFGNFGALFLHKKIPDYIAHCALVFALAAILVGGIIASISLGQLLLTLIGLMLVNFLASGLNNLLTSIFPLFMRGKINAGLFAGILNGFAYVGSTISSYGLGAVADRHGWLSVFWLLIACCAGACLLLFLYLALRYFLCKSKTE